VKRTTLVFACWEALHEVLNAAGWPAHPTTGAVPEVTFGGRRDDVDEMVILPGRTLNDQAAQSWVTSGRPSKGEEFSLDVWIFTEVPGCSSLDAQRRLRDLVAVVECALRDQTTGMPAGDLLDSIDGLWQWGVADIVPVVGPLGDEGFGGSCRIEIEFKTRL
jgi:hypothetical protein